MFYVHQECYPTEIIISIIHRVVNSVTWMSLKTKVKKFDETANSAKASAQRTFTPLNSTIETLEKGIEYIQS